MSLAAPWTPSPRSDDGQTYDRIKNYINIIYALMMHDIKNRFFGSGLGQILMIMWPFAHMLVLITVYYVTKKPYEYGESVIQYSAVSIYPFIIFNYVSRWIVFSAVTNKPFLNLPIIKPLDILIARTLLEIVSITIVGVLMLIFVSAFGYTIMPSDPLAAVCAVLSTIFLAMGMGFLNAPFAFMLPMWNVVMALIIIMAWICSGVAINVNSLPEAIRTPLTYNPLLHCVEWFRASYYPDYPTDLLNKAYVIQCGLVMLTIGLTLNKLLRRFY